MTDFQEEKQLVIQFLKQIEEQGSDDLLSAMQKFISNENYQFYGCHPFNQIQQLEGVVEKVWQPLKYAFNHLQRRQDIFLAGQCILTGKVWVMSMGHFMGHFDRDWLGIRAHQKPSLLRYAEFHCVEQGKITQSSFFCDILDMMQQVGWQPLPMQMGAQFTCPGPKHHDGLLFDNYAPEQATKTLAILNNMIDTLSKLNQSGNDRCKPELLAESWHSDMVWYGPAGIGTCYTIERYQQHHQYPFREGLTDKKFNGHICRFAEGNYACFFGWPNLTNTPIGGFLGLPGGSQTADMRVVDVYRRDGDKLSENWVIIDLLHWLKQQGLDVLARCQQIGNPK